MKNNHRVIISEQSWGWVAIDTYWQERIAQADGPGGIAFVTEWVKHFCKQNEIDSFSVKLMER